MIRIRMVAYFSQTALTLALLLLPLAAMTVLRSEGR